MGMSLSSRNTKFNNEQLEIFKNLANKITKLIDLIKQSNNKIKLEDFIKELKWRGMIQDIVPGTQEQFQKEITSAYIGFDPTSDSLHIGSLVQIMILKHLQDCGHKPIILVGGATGMVGDPSGKSKERNLLDEATLERNLSSIRKQLEKFLNFDCGNKYVHYLLVLDP